MANTIDDEREDPFVSLSDSNVGSQGYTAQGNLKAPPRRKIIEWILEAWKNVRIDVIKSSFKNCALNIVIDGSEDELIHCFKENQPCSAGYNV